MLPAAPAARRLGLYLFVVQLSQSLAFFAAAVAVFAETASALAVGALLAGVTVAETIGAVGAGTLADRCDRRRLALVSTLVTASAIGLLAAVAGHATLVAGALALVALVATPIRPVVGAALPNLAGDDLGRANGFVQALRAAALTGAPILAGVGLALVGEQAVYAAAAAGFVGAAALLLVVHGDFQVAERSAAPRSPLAGIAAIRADRALAVVIGVGVLAALVVACTVVADLPFALDELDAGETGYGVLVGVLGLGMTAGSLLAPRVLEGLQPSRAFAVGIAVEALGFGAVALSPTLVAAAAAFALCGLGTGVAAVANQLLVQERTPDAVRGRVRATNDALLSAAWASSYAIGGPVVAAAGARTTYGLAAAGCVAGAVIVLTALQAGVVRGPATDPA